MKKSIFICSMIIASLSMTSTYLTVAKADTNQSVDQTTDTLDVSSSQNYNEENNQNNETAPAGATVFARNSSKGPGYYKLPSKSDYLFGNSLSATPAQQEAAVQNNQQESILLLQLPCRISKTDPAICQAVRFQTKSPRSALCYRSPTYCFSMHTSLLMFLPSSSC